MTRLEILFLSEVIFCSRNPAPGHAPGQNGAELLGFGVFIPAANGDSDWLFVFWLRS